MLKHYLCIFLLAQILPLGAQNLWTDFSENNIPAKADAQRYIVPREYRTVRLNLPQLQPLLAAAPERFTAAESEQEIVLSLPLPDGSLGRFRLVEAPVMAPALQAKYPEIRCYSGTGIDDPTATLKCDLTPQGFHAMIRSAQYGTVFIDPYRPGDLEYCIVYRKSDFQSKKEPFSCGVDGLDKDLNLPQDLPEAPGDCKLRRYRLALACTGEYAIFHGGTKPLVLAAMNTTMNRVNGLYERDFAVTMQIIANNDTLIYLDPATDGFSNGNGSTMLGQNQTKCNTIIGSANYDIGHVFSTGGGGVAGLGVVCGNSVKARGVTGLSQPIGDPYDVDYVAHEMGHQFGGNHTFNSSCGGNRNAGTAFEPGSGTTIMAYAGVCSPNNVQSNSDDFFHAITLQEISNYITAGQGSVCPVETITGNNKPTVNGGADRTIPKSTPFALTAAGNDVDGDSLTYTWEQMDNTTAPMPPVSTSTGGPLFRSFKPTPSPTRYFPNLNDLLNNIDPVWEELPGVARTMNFRVSVRDNNPAGGCTEQDNVLLTVAGSAGPFLVTEPNAPTVWFVGDTKTVTWDVAKTDTLPVNCSQVRILLSIDGGYTYPIVLLKNTPNNGSAMVDVPDTLSATCRVMVQAVGNVFFDISNENFSIQNPPNATFLLNITAGSQEQVCTGDTLRFTASIDPVAGFSDPVDLQLEGLPPGASVVLNPNPVDPGNSAEVTVTGLTTPGQYMLTLIASSGPIARDKMIELTVVDNAPATPAPESPSDGATNLSLTPEFNWSAIPGALQYHLQVATSPAFYPDDLVVDEFITDTSLTANGLDTATVYYWRVNVSNACGASPFGPTRAFQTGTYDCGYTFNSTDVPVAISSTAIDTVSSSLDVPGNRLIADVELRLEVSHTWIGDLLATLTGPDGTSALLFDQPGFPTTSSGCNGDSLSLHFDDEAVQNANQLENTCNNLPAIDGVYQPIELLSRFDNRAAAGTWTLQMLDVFPEDGGAITAWSLELCFLDTVPPATLLVNKPLTVPNGGSGYVTENELELGISNNVPDDGIFTLLSTPQHGTLALNGLPLGIGDAFTQADILTSSVEYTHSGDTATSDSFLFDAVDKSSGGWVHAATFNIIIIQNDLDVAAEVTQTLLCNGDSTAQVTVTVSGGTPPLEYSLNGGPAQASEVFDNLPAGSYTVVVTDMFGFTAETNAVVVDDPAAVDVTANVTDDDIDVQVTGGVPPLEYSLDGQTFQPENTFENLPNGMYTVTVRDSNGCTGTATAEVNVPPLSVLLIVDDQISCNGDSNGVLSVQVTGGVGPYQYSLDGQNFQNENVFSGLPAGSYTVVVQDDSGSTATTNAEVLTDPPAIMVSADVVLNDITVMASGGTGALQYSLDGQNFQPENTFADVPNGDYTVTVQDANGCTATTTATVDIPPLVIVDISVIGTILCAGDTVSVSVSAIGGFPPYEYSLDNGPYQQDSVFENVVAGTHTIQVRDVEGQVISQMITVAQPAALNALITLIGDDLFAMGIGGTPPYQYALDNGPPQSSGEFLDLDNGIHVLYVFDANGCMQMLNFFLDYPPLTLSVNGIDPSCANGDDGAITVSVIGGTPPYTCAMDGQPCMLTGLLSGTYTIVITDDLGDTVTAMVTLNDPPALSATADVSSDTITVSASGGTGALQYSLDGQTYQSSPVFPGLPNGTYTVWVQDENGCTTTIPNVVVDYVGTVSPEAIWGLTIHPNPSAGLFRLTFRLAPAGVLRADVFDAAGRLVREQRFEALGTAAAIDFDIRGVPAGVYWLRLVSGNQVGMVRLVVQ